MTPEAAKSETLKRRRERRSAILIFIIFVLSTLLRGLLSDRRQTYGFVQSLLYFGLVHLNLILIMLLIFLVSRNLIKAYLVRRSGTLGSSLRWRVISSLMGFSLLPSILLFAGSSYIIRQGFDRWFGNLVARALEDAQAITDVHYQGVENNLGFFSERVQESLLSLNRAPTQKDIEFLKSRFPVEAVEVYPDLVNPPLRYLKEGLEEWAVPRAASESLQRALAGTSFPLIRHYGDGDLVQRYSHLRLPVGGSVVLVLSQTIPLGLKTRIDDLRRTFSGYQQTRLLKDGLKSDYTAVLLTLFLLTMFVVSWFGLYLAKTITEPVAELLRGTEAFREGQWDYRIPTVTPAADRRIKAGTGADADLEVLKAAFNLMAEEVGRRGRQLEEANGQLISLVRELEDRERYLETLLSSIRRGVLVIDNGGFIRRINQEALQFAVVDAQGDLQASLGRHWREVFPTLGSDEETRDWLDRGTERESDRIFEIATGTGRAAMLRSVRATGLQLRDERSDAFGWMVILEDVSDAARLERLAAWQEVARRVAHEIKNPLTPIQISADRLYRRMSARMEQDPHDGPVFKECVRQIQKQVRVIRDLVREFSEFSKLPEPKFASLNLGKLIDGILKDYRFTHPDCRFEVVSSGEVWVRADGEYMRRLVVNLTDNALHSIEAAKIKEPCFQVVLSAGEESVAVAFVDNGPGIAPAMREKIFDPYITSKASGLGLGLAIVRRIAMEHSGRIRCEEAEGGRFVLELPVLSVGDSGPV